MHPALHAEKNPDKPAYIMAGSGRVVTYRELDERSNQGAQLFYSLGLRRGDHIAFCMENNAEFLTLAWAAQRSGLYFTAISSRLTAVSALVRASQISLPPYLARQWPGCPQRSR